MTAVQKEKIRKYIVYMNGNRICPKCSGMMARYSDVELRFRCMDCGARFGISGQPSEKELELAEVETWKRE